ncbi:MAG TPA: DUF6152 family protein [Gammaproteobacteria bacterium]
MRTIPGILAASAIAVSLAATTASAHHGYAAYSNEVVTVTGVMTEFRFVNPHVQLYFDVKNEDGVPETWSGTITAPNKLARGGWTKNTLQPGDEVQIRGEVARNGGHSIRVREIILLATGERLSLREIL